jgi:ATP-dependent Clp protease adaptor protein ClpS
MLNDDFTPMDFVVEVLRDIFVMHPLTANQVMLEIHHHDRAIVGSYTHEIALQRVAQVKALSELEGHPLLCIAEPEPNI